jgi:hypothetical protein
MPLGLRLRSDRGTKMNFATVRKFWAALPALLFALLLLPATSWAHRPAFPTGARIGPKLMPFTAPIISISGTWTAITHAPSGPVDTGLLLTDGTVIMHAGPCTGKWVRLTPNSAGSYVKGTWSNIASLPSGYAPLYFASQVLSDGRVIVNGGEYNGAASCNNNAPNWVKLGAIYDPVANKWTSVKVPKPWQQIGDAESVMLANGKYMLASCCDSPAIHEAEATISGPSITWSAVSSPYYPDEEQWTLLPDNTVLTVDVWTAAGKNHNDSEIFNPTAGTWSMGAPTPVQLTNTTTFELGAAVLRPNGTVFQAGTNPCNDPTKCAAHTAIYNFATSTWTAGPNFPKISGEHYDEADGPAALLPDGNVLVEASPGEGNPPTHFFEFDGKNLIRVNEPKNAPNIVPFETRMLNLPTGEVLWTDGGFDVEVYAESGKPNSSWAPTVTKSPNKVSRGTKNYSVSGKMFNGLSQGANYGDDAQMSTNYPLVRINNTTTGRVCFARTHGFPMGLSTSASAVTSTQFDMPASSPPAGTLACDAGASQLRVIVDGISSQPVAITVN